MKEEPKAKEVPLLLEFVGLYKVVTVRPGVGRTRDDEVTDTVETACAVDWEYETGVLGDTLG